MLIWYFFGIVLIETACALLAWGAWSNYVLGRGWPTSLAFAVFTISSAIAGALVLAHTIRKEAAGEDWAWAGRPADKQT